LSKIPFAFDLALNPDHPVLKIRLQRSGRENIPFFRLVVAEHRKSAKGKFIEKLGTYNPVEKPWKFEVDTEKVFAWIKKGAKPSSTVARLLKSQGVKDMEQYIDPMRDRKKKGAAEAAAAGAGAAPAAPVTPAAVEKAA
jgi:small subunit ribosomal protein S16